MDPVHGKMRTLRIWLLTISLLIMFTSSISLAARPQITLMHHMGGQAGTNFINLCKEIGEKLGVDIVVVRAAGDRDLLERALVMAAGGVLPDVIRVDQQQIRPLLRANLLAALDDRVRRDAVRLDHFISISREAFTYQGSLYAIPAEASNNILFYNRTFFQNAGLDHPPTDWNTSSWTWNDFVTAARRLSVDTTGDGIIDQYGLNSIGNFYFYPWLWGADWITPDLRTFLGNSPRIVEIMQGLADLRLVDNAIDDRSKLFAQGGTAMSIEGSYKAADFMKTDLDWDMAVWPKGTERTTVFYPNGFAISRTSKLQDIAWKIVKYLTLEKDGVEQYTQAVNRIPTHRAYFPYYLSLQNEAMPGKANQVSVEGLGHGKIWALRYATNWPQIDDIMTAAWEKAWTGSSSYSGAMAEVTPTIEKLLAD